MIGLSIGYGYQTRSWLESLEVEYFIVSKLDSTAGRNISVETTYYMGNLRNWGAIEGISSL